MDLLTYAIAGHLAPPDRFTCHHESIPFRSKHRCGETVMKLFHVVSPFRSPVASALTSQAAIRSCRSFLRLSFVGHTRLFRRCGRKRIVAPDGSEIVPTPKPQPDGTLVKALARAWREQRWWHDRMHGTAPPQTGWRNNLQP